MRKLIIVAVYILFSNLGYSQITEEYTLKNISINDSENTTGVSFFKRNYIVYTKPKRNQKIHDSDFYVSMSDDTGAVFNEEFFKANVNSFINEIDLVYTHDFKKVYFTRSYIDNKKKEHFDIYSADINEENKFINIKQLPICYTNFSTAYPSLSKDDKTLYFASNRRESLGGFDIFKVAIFENGKRFGKVINLGEKVNTSKDEITPFVIDEKLYFSSNGRGGVGMQDIFSIKLNLENDAVNLGEPLNSTKDDYDYLRKPYKNFGYISSSRDSGKGKSDIYYFKVKEIAPIFVESEVVEEESVVEEGVKNEIDDKINTKTQNKENAIPKTEEESITKETQTEGIITDIPDGTSIEHTPKEGVVETANKTTEVTSNATESQVDEEIDSNEDETKNSYVVYDEEIIYKEKEELAGNFYAFQRRKVYNTIFVETGRVLKKRIEFTQLEKSCVNSIEKLDDIYFNLDRFDIRPDAQIQVNKAIKIMEKCPNVNFVASSFTDSRGSAEYNRTLSQRRADSVVNYILANSSISQDRIKGIGYGESGLKNRCYNGVKCSEKEHQINRRTEIEVYILK